MPTIASAMVSRAATDQPEHRGHQHVTAGPGGEPGQRHAHGGAIGRDRGEPGARRAGLDAEEEQHGEQEHQARRQARDRAEELRQQRGQLAQIQRIPHGPQWPGTDAEPLERGRGRIGERRRPVRVLRQQLHQARHGHQDPERQHREDAVDEDDHDHGGQPARPSPPVQPGPDR
jgi:hypothetical protein